MSERESALHDQRVADSLRPIVVLVLELQRIEACQLPAGPYEQAREAAEAGAVERIARREARPVDAGVGAEAPRVQDPQGVAGVVPEGLLVAPTDMSDVKVL